MVRVEHAVAFADGPGGGNPCPIVFGAAQWSDEEMRAAAEGFGHETAFVLPPVAGGDVRLRYFVPAHEMEMCVHATVASLVHLQLGPVARVETPLAIRRVWVDGDSAMVELSEPEFGPELDAPELLAALGVEPPARCRSSRSRARR